MASRSRGAIMHIVQRHQLHQNSPQKESEKANQSLRDSKLKRNSQNDNLNDSQVIKLQDEPSIDFLAREDTNKGPDLFTKTLKARDEKLETERQMKRARFANYAFHGQKYRFSKTSLFCLDPSNAFRTKLVWLITHKKFDNFILLAIILNSFSLAFYDFEKKESIQNHVIDYFGYTFSCIFTLEAILKILAMGFIVSSKSYLRDAWNTLDFIIVLAGLVELGMLEHQNQPPSLRFLRTLRVLRPLKTIKTVPAMRKMVASLLMSIPGLLNVGVFFIFFFMVFGIMGLQQFSGGLYGRCRLNKEPLEDGTWPVLEHDIMDRPCQDSGFFTRQCPKGSYCGNWIEEGHEPFEFESRHQFTRIQYGVSSFDNMQQSLIGVFQITTFDNWTMLMYNMQDGSDGVMALIFCISLVLFGSFFLINLILAVIMQSYSEQSQIERLEEEEEEENQKQKQQQGTGMSALAQALKAAKAKKKEEEKIEASGDIDTRIKKGEEKKKENNLILGRLEKAIKKKYVENKRSDYGMKNEKEVKDMMMQKFDQKLLRGKTNNIGSIPRFSVVDMSGQHTEQADYYMNFALDLKKEIKEKQMMKMIFSKIGYKMKQVVTQRQEVLENQEKLKLQLEQDKLNKRAKGSIVLKACLKLVQAKPFRFFIFFCILFNSLVLAFDSHPVNQGREEFAFYSNWAFFFIFLVEMILKLLGLGFKAYFKDKFNAFDAFLVFVSVIDLLLTQVAELSIGGGAFLAFRSFRLMRIFKLASQWKKLQELLETMANTFKDIRDFSILLILFIFTYSLLGRELFAYKVGFDSDNKPVDPLKSDDISFPDSTFNTIQEAMVSIFIVLANDGWSTIYIEHYRAGYPIISTVYFIFLLMFGQYIMVNLFLVIMLQNFEDDSQKNEAGDEFSKPLTSLFDKIFFCCAKEPGKEEEPNKVRVFFKKIVKHKAFDGSIIGAIVISSICLAFENPLNNPKGSLTMVLNDINYFLTFVFIVEAIVKIIALGFIFNGQKSYLRQTDNLVDFIVSLFSILDIILENSSLKFLRVIRLLRVLRPIRIINRNEGLKVSIQSLVRAIPNISNVTFLNLMFFAIFAIVGINLFKGKFWYCTDALSIKEKSIDNFLECQNQGGAWIRRAHNFDNFSNSIFSIFSIANAVGWAATMYQSSNFTGIGEVGERHSSFWNVTFFIFFIILGNFFMVNLFVGVVTSTYNREKENLGKNYLLTEGQKKWVEAKLILIDAKPRKRYIKPDSSCRRSVFSLVQNRKFDYFIQVCIILNTLVLTVKWPLMDEKITFVTNMINYGFGLIFTVEIVLKLIAYGKQFGIDSWDIFDLVIVIGSWIGFVISEFSEFKRLGLAPTIIRTFRIGRLFKLFKRNKSLKVIFQTFITSLPAVVNVGSLLLLMIFIYAVMGMFLFADVQLNGGFLDSHANFQSVGIAMITLLRAATGENWHEIAYALQRERSITFQCISNPTYEDYVANRKETVGCGYYWAVVVFFISYIMIVALVFLNLFIAIILQAFDDIQNQSNKVFNQDLKDHFLDTWVLFDPKATRFIKQSHFPKFMEKLGKPLGWQRDMPEESQQKFIEKMEINLHSLDESRINESKYIEEMVDKTETETKKEGGGLEESSQIIQQNSSKSEFQLYFEFYEVLEGLTMLLMVNIEMEKYIQKMQEEAQNNQEINQSEIMGQFQQDLKAGENVEDAEMVRNLKKKGQPKQKKTTTTSVKKLGESNRRQQVVPIMPEQQDSVRQAQTHRGLRPEPLDDSEEQTIRLQTSRREENKRKNQEMKEIDMLIEEESKNYTVMNQQEKKIHQDDSRSTSRIMIVPIQDDGETLSALRSSLRKSYDMPVYHYQRQQKKMAVSPSKPTIIDRNEQDQSKIDADILLQDVQKMLEED